MKLSITGSAGRYPDLDGLRGLAIIAVLLRHAAHYWPQPLEGEFWNLWYNGWLGVNLFFALSGFLISQHLLAWWPTQSTREFLSIYALKRSLRIIPIYLTALLLSISSIIPDYTPTQPITWEITIQHLLFVQEYYSSPLIIPLWSVAIEEKFYLLAPLIIALFLHSQKIKFIKGLCITITAFEAGKLLIIWLVSPYDYSQYFWSFRAPFQHAAINIAMGSIAALIMHQRPTLNLCTTTHRKVSAALSSMLIITLFSVNWLKTEQWLAIDLSSWLFTAACAGLILLHAQPNTPPHPILGSRFLRFFAKISYPLYATHIMTIPLAISLSNSISDIQDNNFLLFFTTYIAISITLALAIHLLIEKPFLNIKDRLQYPKQPTQARPQSIVSVQ